MNNGAKDCTNVGEQPEVGFVKRHDSSILESHGPDRLGESIGYLDDTTERERRAQLFWDGHLGQICLRGVANMKGSRECCLKKRQSNPGVAANTSSRHGEVKRRGHVVRVIRHADWHCVCVGNGKKRVVG